MKILWKLSADIKDINPNKYYYEYDDKNLISDYWMYDIVSFIMNNNGNNIYSDKKQINQYEILFSSTNYDFRLQDYIKFRSGRFYTSAVIVNKHNYKKTLYNKSV